MMHKKDINCNTFAPYHTTSSLVPPSVACSPSADQSTDRVPWRLLGRQPFLRLHKLLKEYIQLLIIATKNTELVALGL